MAPLTEDVQAPVVIKIGGSLLHAPDLAARFARLRAQLPNDTRIVLVIGGGTVADLVRDWDRRFSLGETASHWLAIRAMRLTEELAHRLIPGSVIAETWADIANAWTTRCIAILAMEPLLRVAEQAGEPTPRHSWDVTSDSLAAWAAGRLEARLILAKSTEKPEAFPELATDAVDAAFLENLKPGTVVDWVNLRSDDAHLE